MIGRIYIYRQISLLLPLTKTRLSIRIPFLARVACRRHLGILLLRVVRNLFLLAIDAQCALPRFRRVFQLRKVFRRCRDCIGRLAQLGLLLQRVVRDVAFALARQITSQRSGDNNGFVRDSSSAVSGASDIRARPCRGRCFGCRNVWLVVWGSG